MTKEELYNLYIVQNLTRVEIAKKYGVCEGTIKQYLYKFRIIKDPKQVIENTKNTIYNKYGVNNASQVSEIRNKINQTNLRKFNTICPLLNESIKEKTKETCLEKYGTEHSSSNFEIQQKISKTCKQKSPETLEKIKTTNKERLGTEYYFNSDQYKKDMLNKYKVEHALQSKELKEKKESTCLEKFGDKIPSKTEFVKDKMKKSCKEKYNTEWAMQNPEINDKRINTCLKNNSFNKSKPEELIYKLLKTKFKEVKRQYKSIAYPWNCDFYLPEIDLYIEYQGHWTHCFKPFESSEEDIEKLNEMRQKAVNSRAYAIAIKTWTVLDAEKREWAKRNNLNWIEFFNINDFKAWFDSLA